MDEHRTKGMQTEMESTDCPQTLRSNDIYRILPIYITIIIIIIFVLIFF